VTKEGETRDVWQDCETFHKGITVVKDVVVAYENEKLRRKNEGKKGHKTFNCGDTFFHESSGKSMMRGGNSNQIVVGGGTLLHNFLPGEKFLALVSRLLGDQEDKVKNTKRIVRKATISTTSSGSLGKGYGIDGKKGSGIRGHFFIPGLV